MTHKSPDTILFKLQKVMLLLYIIRKASQSIALKHKESNRTTEFYFHLCCSGDFSENSYSR